MLRIFKDIYIHFILKTALLFVLLFCVVVFCINLDLQRTMLWISLAFSFLIAFLILVSMINNLHKKLKEDIDALSFYLKKIDAKEYDAKIEIKNYLDFLELSLLLKNLIKRVVQKDKKAAKK